MKNPFKMLTFVMYFLRVCAYGAAVVFVGLGVWKWFEEVSYSRMWGWSMGHCWKVLGLNLGYAILAFVALTLLAELVRLVLSIEKSLRQMSMKVA